MIIEINPCSAQPLARKSSMINTLSSGDKNFLETMTWFLHLCVKDSTSATYISPSILILLDFLANTTGTLKYFATTHAIPIPEASIVTILLISLPAKRFLNSSPICSNNEISIWWFKKLSTFNTLPSFTIPSLRIRSSKKFILSSLYGALCRIYKYYTEYILQIQEQFEALPL